MTLTESEAAPITVLTVDDHPILREGVAALIGTQTDMVLIADAPNGAEAINAFRAHRPDVTLMDLQMPHMDGAETIQAIRAEFPDARFVVLTTYEGYAQAIRALKAGAAGYLLKSALRKELLGAIRAVHAGRRHVPAEIVVEMVRHMEGDDLTAREIQVLHMVALGSSDKRIASQLDLSTDTVRAHMRNIRAKLGAESRTHAVSIALKRGIFLI